MPESFDDNLGKLLEKAWDLLKEGSSDRNSVFRNPSISTIDANGHPVSRTMVLREVDPNKRIFRFHTDQRSTKYDELNQNPNISCLFYNAPKKIQIRLQCCATIHTNNEIARKAWDQSTRMSRICYTIKTSPGTPVQKPRPAPTPDEEEIINSFSNFCVIIAKIKKLEWLYLCSAGHQRAVFEWTQHNSYYASWLTP